MSAIILCEVFLLTLSAISTSVVVGWRMTPLMSNNMTKTTVKFILDDVRKNCVTNSLIDLKLLMNLE